jgi:hypothetical protein
VDGTFLCALNGFLTAPVIESAWGRKMDIILILILALLGLGVQLIALARDPVQDLVNYVNYGGINYIDTIVRPNHSWLILQIGSLKHWNICNIDAYTLHQWLGHCS